jgi:DNA-binding transcriptional LysR family regulator
VWRFGLVRGLPLAPDPDLERIVAAWPSLSPAVRRWLAELASRSVRARHGEADR